MRLRPPLILAYHAVGNVAREHDPSNLVVRPDAFRAQVRALVARRYKFVTMAGMAGALGASSGPPDGLCALTFDDGAFDAVPDLLAELDVPGTLYVCPGLCGAPHPFLAPEAGVRLLTAGELSSLAARDDIELGSHTNRHTVLASADRAVALREMVSSRRALEEIAGRVVGSFAYPECGYSEACPAAARSAGYSTAVTCGPRGSWTPFELRRVSVDALENRITWELKSRDLWWRVWGSAAGRAARAAARPLRHGVLR